MNKHILAKNEGFTFQGKNYIISDAIVFSRILPPYKLYSEVPDGLEYKSEYYCDAVDASGAVYIIHWLFTDIKGESERHESECNFSNIDRIEPTEYKVEPPIKATDPPKGDTTMRIKSLMYKDIIEGYRCKVGDLVFDVSRSSLQNLDVDVDSFDIYRTQKLISHEGDLLTKLEIEYSIRYPDYSDNIELIRMYFSQWLPRGVEG